MNTDTCNDNNQKITLLVLHQLIRQLVFKTVLLSIVYAVYVQPGSGIV